MPRFLVQSLRRMGLSSTEMGRLWDEQEWVGVVDVTILQLPLRPPAVVEWSLALPYLEVTVGAGERWVFVSHQGVDGI